MKIRTMVNDLSIDGKEYPRGAKLDVDDGVGRGLVTRGLVSEIEGRKVAPEATPVTEAGKGKGDKK